MYVYVTLALILLEREIANCEQFQARVQNTKYSSSTGQCIERTQTPMRLTRCALRCVCCDLSASFASPCCRWRAHRTRLSWCSTGKASRASSSPS